MKAVHVRVMILVVFVLAGCASAGDGADDLVASDAVASTSVPTLTADPTRTPASDPTATPEPTVEPTATSEPAATATPKPEPTATVEPATAAATPTPEPTAVPEPAATPEPEPTEEPEESKTEIEPTDYAGEVKAIRTSTGLVLAVHDQTPTGFEVITPCYNLQSINAGLRVTGPLDVLIDPGHGGEETGAVGPNGLKESTVNLQVAELVRAELLDRGFSVELTRYGDQRVAIQSRAALANSLAPRVFMSIHHNGGFPEPFPVAGTEVFVQLDDPESQRLGGLVFEEIQAAFADIDAEWMGSEETFGVAWRKNDEGTDLYGVLRRTPSLVSVLTEAMFISTLAEAELLALPETLEAEALALSNALERWFNTADPGEGYIEGVIFEGDLGNGGGTEGCLDPPIE